MGGGRRLMKWGKMGTEVGEERKWEKKPREGGNSSK